MMGTITGEDGQPTSLIKLASGTQSIEKCEECNHNMVNIDEDDLRLGDLSILKKAGVRVSNPNTKREICINCELPLLSTMAAGLASVATWMDSDNDDDDDDSSFFGGSGGGFGGFGGGVFSGGGASGGF